MGGGSLRVNAKLVVSDVHIGDSIAVNGICLTVTSFDKNGFTAEQIASATDKDIEEVKAIIAGKEPALA